MDASEEGIFTCEWHDAKGFWLDPPLVGICAGWVQVTLSQGIGLMNEVSTVHFASLSAVYDVETRLRSPLAQHYCKFIYECLSHIQRPGQPKLAALIIEPLVLGAGGMVFVDPLFQRILIDAVRMRGMQDNQDPPNSKLGEWCGMPVIFDEVFVGLYRIGLRSCSSLLGVTPDVSVYAKLLTGGLVPMAVTLASDSIYQAFKGETKAEALLHGHSYTAHAVGCEVANESLDLLDKLSQSDQ
jgi:bifunctional dethiobiotin synthetase / adenosylmethionine---8-amino-7-oxononanoate aminotransferase